MTVTELIEFLKTCDGNLPVFFMEECGDEEDSIPLLQIDDHDRTEIKVGEEEEDVSITAVILIHNKQIVT